MKLKDSNFLTTPYKDKPHELQPWLCFNDHPKQKTKIYFKSTLRSFLVGKFIGPYEENLLKNDPVLSIEIPIGGYARIPHSCFNVYSLDGMICHYSIRSIVNL